jgi:hypothetical protein
MPNATSTSPLLTPNDLASAIAQRLVANLPGADSLAQILQPTISAIFQGAISQPGAPVDSLDSLLAPLIQYGGQLVGAPIFSASAPSALAQSISALLDPYLRAPFATAPMPDPNKFPPLMKAAQESQDNLKADFAALAKQEPFKTIIGVFKDSGLIDWANQSLGSATLAAVWYSPDKVAQVLRSIVKSLIQKYGQLLQPLVNYVEAELAASAARSLIAEAIGEALDNLPFSVKSDMAIGSRVHRVLQESYTTQHRIWNDIVIERFNPYAGKAELVVIGPTTATPGASGLQFRAVPLEQLVLDPVRDPVYAFTTLRMAMAGFKLYEGSWLRADLVDFGYNMMWEIKPSSNLFGGVWQETMYRVTYNVLRLALGTVIPQVKAVPMLLSPGGYWSEADAKTFSSGLTGAQLLSDIPVGDAIAFPFQVAALPGLIGYFVLRKPWAELLFVVLAALQDAIKKILDELKKTAKALGEILGEIEIALQAIGEVLSRWIGVIIVIAAVVVAIYLLWPILVGTAAAGGATLATAGALIIIIIVVAGSKSGSGAGGKGKDGTTATTEVDIAGVRVSGIPVDQVQDFLAEVAKQIQRISTAASKFAAS